MSVDELQVEILVMDYDRFGRNNELGSVSFGCDVNRESGKVHWNKVIIKIQILAIWAGMLSPTLVLAI